jgi:hypothetical protein
MKKLKTITLCQDDNPSWVLCPGHVTQKQFNDAFKNEGWSERGSYKQKDLKYEYWVAGPARRKSDKFYMKQSLPGKPGAKPYTVTPWD